MRWLEVSKVFSLADQMISQALIQRPNVGRYELETILAVNLYLTSLP